MEGEGDKKKEGNKGNANSKCIIHSWNGERERLFIPKHRKSQSSSHALPTHLPLKEE